MSATIRCFLALAVAAVASGCAGTVPKEVNVPVAVRCEVDMPVPPAWATKTLKKDATIFDQAKAMLAERQQRIAYEDELRSALEVCADEIGTGADDSADEAPGLDE